MIPFKNINQETLAIAAERYAADRGWAVFPVRPGTKEPHTILAHHGYKSATKDVKQIREWWTRFPDNNIGVALGSAGLLVVDIDGPAGRRAAEEFGVFDGQTLAVQSGRADGGEHRYYLCPDLGFPIRKGKLGEGLELHVDSITVPPSGHESGRPYRWLAEYVIAPLPSKVLQWIVDREASRVANEPDYTLGRAAPSSQWDPLPMSILEAERNDRLFKFACWRRKEGADRRQILSELREANKMRCVPALPDAELRAIAKSAAGYRPGDGRQRRRLPRRRIFA